MHLRQTDVRQARLDAGVEGRRVEVRRDDGGHLGAVAVVDQLEELLFRPRRGALHAQIVEHQHRRVADHLEQLVVANLAARLVGRPQVVEQVGHDHEKRRLPVGDAAAGDRRREVRLAAAARPREDEPAGRGLDECVRRRDRLGERFLVRRAGAAATRAQLLEREPG